MAGRGVDVSGGTQRAAGGPAPRSGGDRQAADGESRGGDDVRTVPVDGHRVAYTEFGDPSGEPVVAFHGTPGSRLFASVYDDLAGERGVRVLSFDRPGYGDSDDWQGYDAAATPRVAAALLDDASVQSAGLLAFSGGASHALATAADAPERVDRVDVVAGAVPSAFAAETPRVQRVLGALAGRTPRLLSGLLQAQAWAAERSGPEFVAAQYATDGTGHVPASVLDATRRDFLEALDGGTSGVVRESRQAVRAWPVDPASVRVPVRWRHGRDDANVSVSGVRRFVDALPEATLTVLDTDHLGALATTREPVLAGRD